MYAVPAAFVWKDVASGTDVIGLYHPGEHAPPHEVAACVRTQLTWCCVVAGGYGGINVGDCVIVPGLDHALALAWNGDNSGPHNVDQALAIIKQIQVRLVHNCMIGRSQGSQSTHHPNGSPSSPTQSCRDQPLTHSWTDS